MFDLNEFYFWRGHQSFFTNGMVFFDPLRLSGDYLFYWRQGQKAAKSLSEVS